MSEKRIIVVDSQMIEMIQLCPRKWYYTFGRNLGPSQVPDYFERGGLVHEVLDRYHSNGKDINKAIDGAGAKAAELQLSAEECDVVFANLRDYADHYAGETWEVAMVPHEEEVPNPTDPQKTIRVITQKPFVERTFAKVIYETEHYQFIAQGIIDLGVLIPRVAGITLVDHKSEKRRGPFTDLSNQFILYCWAMGCNTLIKNIIGFQKTLKPAERFRREVISYDQARIDEWVENVQKWLRLLVYYMESDDWPMNWSSCNKFDGCVFSRICSSSPESREFIIERDYVLREPWDVGRRL